MYKKTSRLQQIIQRANSSTTKTSVRRSNKNNINIDRVKADLAKTTMELSLQRELAGKDGKGPQVREPLVEPEGRAPEGMAYQQ